MGLTPLPPLDLQDLLKSAPNVMQGNAAPILPVGGLDKLPPLAPPSMAAPGMDASASALPNVPPPLKPLVQNGSFRAQQEQGYQNDLQKLAPHPSEPGFWHKLGHVAAKIGNIAGDIAAPSTMALIPGTDLNNEVRSTQDQRALAELHGEDRSEQQNAEQNAERQRQLDIEQQRADQEQPKQTQPIDLSQAYANAVQAAITAGRDPMSDPVVGHIAAAIHNIQPPKAAKPMEHVPLLGADGKPMIANFHPDTGKYTDSAGNEIANPKPIPPPPNYGEMILPTKTATYMDPKTGLPTEFQWNEQTKKYDIPVGMSATNAYGHEAAQAGAVERAGESVIADLEANKDKIGTLGAWIAKNGLNTPIADPTLQSIQAELSSFAALNPAMHGARGTEAMKHFEQLIGGLQQNPDATIAGIRAIIKTAGAINPGLGHAAGGGGASGSWEHTATGKDGHQIGYRDGKWYDVQSGKPL